MFARFIKLLLFLLILSIPLGQFGRVPGLDPTIGVYLTDILLTLFVFCGLVYLLSKRQLKTNLAIGVGLAFTVWALTTLVLGTSSLTLAQTAISALYWVRWVLALALFVVIYSFHKTEPEILNDVPKWLVFSGLLLAGIGFGQLVIFPDFGKLDPSLGWDPHLNRLNSSFFDPNFTGAYLVLCLAVLGGIRGGRGTRWIRGVVAAVLTVAIFFTFSRSTWLMLAIIVFIYGLFKARWLLLISLVVAFGAYFAVPRVQTRLAGITDPADSAQFRIASWQEGLTLSSRNLLTGVGFNALRYAKDASEFYDYRPDLSTHSGAGFDSSLLVVLATTGIPGLFIFGLFYLAVVVEVLRGNRNFREKLLIVAALVALLVESNFINSLFYSPIMVLEFVSLGFLVD